MVEVAGGHPSISGHQYDRNDSDYVILRKKKKYKSKLNRYSLNLFSNIKSGHEKTRIMKLSKSRDQINKGSQGKDTHYRL